jgi:hypothetical protein
MVNDDWMNGFRAGSLSTVGVLALVWIIATILAG